MTEDGGREDLRRAAFGRPDGAADERRAAEALALLAQLEASASATVAPPEEQPTDEQAVAVAAAAAAAAAAGIVRRDAGAAVTDPAGQAGRPGQAARAGQAARPGLAARAARAEPDPSEVAIPTSPAAASRRWSGRSVALIAVAGVVGGVTLGLVALPGVLDAATDAPRGTTVFVPDGATAPKVGGEVDATPTGGDLDTAALWLDGEQTDADVFPYEFPQLDLDPRRTRLVVGSSDQWRLWVGDRADGSLCLLAAERTASSEDPIGLANCVSADAFEENGLTVTSGANSAFWDGVTVRSTSQLQVGAG